MADQKEGAANFEAPVQQSEDARRAAQERLDADRKLADKKWASFHGANAKRQLIKGYKQLSDFDAAYKSLIRAPGLRAKEGMDWRWSDAYEEVRAEILASQDVDSLRSHEAKVFKRAIPDLVDGYLHVLIGRAEWTFAEKRLGRSDWGMNLYSGSGKSSFEDVDIAYQRVKSYLISTANTGTLGPLPVLRAINPFYTQEAHGILNAAKEQWSDFTANYDAGGNVDVAPMVLTMAYLLVGSVALDHAERSNEQSARPDDAAEGQLQSWEAGVYSRENIEYNFQLLREYLIDILNTARFSEPPNPLPDSTFGEVISTFGNPRRQHRSSRLDALMRDMKYRS